MMDFPDFSKCIIFLVFLIQLTNGRSKPKYYKEIKSTSNNNFDLLIFTQHWPQTVCFIWKEESESHKCLLPNDEEWTIHGIWPTQFHKIAPSFCNKSLHFDLAALASIEDELKYKWIDVESGMMPGSFWKHEWDKHGTCASVLDSMSTEKKYFQKGLDLLNEYDMKNVLGKVNIYPEDPNNPTNKYPVQTILDGIKKILEVNVQVMCVKNPKTNESYIFDIRICFDKTLKLMNCDGIVDFPTNCDRSKDVIYPGFVPHQFSVLQI